jgi:hypothetical protein
MGNRRQKYFKKAWRKQAILVFFILGFGIAGILALKFSTADIPNVLYVDKDSTGGQCDDNRGLADISITTPLCSINRALVLAPDNSTVSIRKGLYPASAISRQFPRTSYATFQPYQNEQVQVDSINLQGTSYVRIKGLVVINFISADTHIRYFAGGRPPERTASHHIEFLGNNLRSIQIGEGTDSITIADNLITNPTGYGINMSSGPLPTTNVIIRNNKMDKIGVDAMQMKNFDGLIVENNEISNVDRGANTQAHPDAFQSYGGGKNLIFRNNYLHDNKAQGLFLSDGSVENVVVENNVFHGLDVSIELHMNGVRKARVVNNTVVGSTYFRNNNTDITFVNNISHSLGEGLANQYTKVDNNLIGTHNLSVKGTQDQILPQLRDQNGRLVFDLATTFVNIEARDFHLKEGALAINKASADYATPTDREGRSRVGLPDIGAYEYKGVVDNIPKEGDLNGDSKINGLDLSLVVSRLNTSDLKGDANKANKDGKVNGLDISYVISRYGQ